jgi:hypothetical protein
MPIFAPRPPLAFVLGPEALGYLSLEKKIQSHSHAWDYKA